MPAKRNYDIIHAIYMGPTKMTFMTTPMTKEQQQVREFMKTFGQDTPENPTIPDAKTRTLRVKLLLEEVLELADASGVRVTVAHDYLAGGVLKTDSLAFQHDESTPADLVGVADALADIDYVNQGAAVAYGLVLQPFSDEVHRSNMTKLWKKEEIEQATALGYTVTPVGDKYLVKRPDGKVVKSPSYEPVDLKGVLAKQV